MASRQDLRSWTKCSASLEDLGYSQSMSKPSKPRFLISSTAEEANFSRPDAVEAGAAKLEE